MALSPFRLLLTSFKTLAATHLVLDYGFHVGPASGPSMLPTFWVDGEYVVVDRRYRYGRGVEVGDLVHYKIPIFQNSQGIKRVLGMPGDYVLMGNPDSGKGHMIQVPQGHCWLVGDNLEASRDSRIFGPVPLALVMGKAVARPLPLSRRGFFLNGLRDVDEGREDKKEN